MHMQVIIFFVIANDEMSNIERIMSQSILQNGYAILLANTSDLDNYLLANEQLLQRLVEVKEQKIKERDQAIDYRQTQIDKIDAYIAKQIVDEVDDPNIDKYLELKAQLQAQVQRIRKQNINATYDDVRKTHAFFINTTYKPLVSVAYGYSSVSVTPLPLFGSSVRLKVPIFGDFLADQAIQIKVSKLTAEHKDNKIRWYDFIGHRMIKNISLVVDGVVLDQYGREELEMYYRFHVNDSQKKGWMRCVGQETPFVGTFLQDPTNQTVRERKYMYTGYQTPKQSHEELNLYIPLIFWYNLDPAFALSNWNLTYDKVFIDIEFAHINECVSVIDYAGDGGKFIQPSFINCNLVSNHVYTTPEVAELFKHRTQFSIIRVHKRVERILNNNFAQVNISDIKFAVENLYIHFRPMANEMGMNSAETWRLNDVSTYREVKYASIISVSGTTSLAVTPVYYYECKPSVESVSLISNGSKIYDSNPGLFYNSYIPLRYGGDRIATPHEEGAYLMTFSLFPGEAQPSGYLNFSQSRDQYIVYNSSYIDIDHTVTMTVCATCINFLVMGPGTLSLRYAT